MSRTPRRPRQLSSPAIVRIALVVHDLPQLLKAQIRRRPAPPQNAAHQTLSQAAVKHLQRYSQLQPQSFRRHRQPACHQLRHPLSFSARRSASRTSCNSGCSSQTDHIPPIDAKAVHNASHAGRKQVTPNLQVLNFNGKIENAEDRTAQRRTPFVDKKILELVPGRSPNPNADASTNRGSHRRDVRGELA